MKGMVERIGPLVPAFATVGASVCVSSLLLAAGPQTLGPLPVVPPPTREVGRVVVSLSPPAPPLSRGRGPAARPAERRSRSAPPRALATSTPISHPSSKQVSRVGAPPAPPPSPSNPPPAPPVTPQPASVTVSQATTDKTKKPKSGNKPGWGHGDPNHNHTGPPGKASQGKKNEATSPQSGPPVPADRQHGSGQNGEKKSTGP